MSDLMSPLLLVAGPVAFMFVATVSLMQFKVLLMAFVKFANTGSKSLKGTFLEFIRPGLKNYAANLEAWFGSADAWKPNTTHVILMALIIAVLYGMERIRAEVARARKD